MRELPQFQAKCAHCGRLFNHPSPGDFAYGEVILCTADGKHYAITDGFGEFPERVGKLAEFAGPDAFWLVLASLADPISDQPLTDSIRCPHCGSDDLEYWEGRQTGTARVPEATFSAASPLADDDLLRRIKAALPHDGRN